MLIAAPLAAGALTLLLQRSCPLYVTGKRSGFCNYQGKDLLGGWVSGVIIAFLFDALFVAGLLPAGRSSRSSSASASSRARARKGRSGRR